MQINWKIKRSVPIKSGFTLVELLVVISILGILASIALVAFTSSQIKGRDAQRKSDLTQVSRALEIFYQDYQKYPPSDGANSSGQIYSCPFNSVSLSGTACAWGTGAFQDTDAAGSVKTIYMKVLVKDPVSSQRYFYRVDATGQKYQIFAHLENSQDPALITTSHTCGGSNACNFGVSSTNTSPSDASW